MANKSAGVAVVGHAGAARGAGGMVGGCAVESVEGGGALIAAIWERESGEGVG